MKQNGLQGRLPIIFTLPLVLILMTSWAKWTSPTGYMDEGLLLVYPLLMLDGWQMHVDFQTGYGPGAFWLLAAMYEVFGASQAVERGVAIALRVLLVIFAGWLVRPFGLWAGFCGALCVALIVSTFPLRPNTWLCGQVLILGGLALATWAVQTPNRRFPAACAAAFLFTLATCVRLDTVAMGGVFCVMALVAFLPKTLRLGASLAAAAGMLPMAIHVCWVGMPAVWENMIIDPIVRTAPGRVLPIPPGGWFDAWRFYGLVAALIMAMLVCAGAFYRKTAHKQVLFVLLAGTLAAWAALPHTLQRADLNHLALTWTVAIVSVTGGVFYLLPMRLKWVGAAVLLVPLGLFQDVLWRTEKSILRAGFRQQLSAVVENDGRRLFVFPHTKEKLDKLIHAINQLPGKSVYITSGDLRLTNYSDLHLYFLLPQLRPAGYLFEMNPGVANRVDSPLLADLKKTDILIRNHQWDNWNEPNASTRPGSSQANELVEREFELVGRFGTFALWARKSAGE